MSDIEYLVLVIVSTMLFISVLIVIGLAFIVVRSIGIALVESFQNREWIEIIEFTIVLVCMIIMVTILVGIILSTICC